MGCLGPETPRASRAMSPKPAGIWRLLTRQSPAVTVVEYVRIRTSLGFGVGLASSFNSRTSGGPYLSYTTAFIRFAPESLGFARSNQARHLDHLTRVASFTPFARVVVL